MAKYIYFVAILALFSNAVRTDDVLENQKRFKLNNGNLMPMVGLGTSMISNGTLMEEILDYALGAGYRLIDSALNYGNQHLLGNALKVVLPKHNLTRQDIWVTTKISLGESAYSDLQESIDLLGIGYVDLLLAHWPGMSAGDPAHVNNSRLRNETWATFVKSVNDGLAKNLGVSNYLVKHLKDQIKKSHGIVPAVNQIEWHLYYHPQDVLDFCNEHGVLLQGYSTLGGTGNTEFLNSTTVKGIASEVGKSTAQVLLKWAGQHNVAVIPKSTKRSHIEENFKLNFTLPDEDIVTLDNFCHLEKYQLDPQCIP